jgi:hypothetical protein
MKRLFQREMTEKSNRNQGTFRGDRTIARSTSTDRGCCRKDRATKQKSLKTVYPIVKVPSKLKQRINAMKLLKYLIMEMILPNIWKQERQWIWIYIYICQNFKKYQQAMVKALIPC